MSSFIIEGGHRLSGSIEPQGAKNEALEVLSAVLLTSEEVVITNVPEILDVKNLISLMGRMGVQVDRKAKGEYSFNAEKLDTEFIESPEFIRMCSSLRGSVMVAGPLLARLGHVWFPKPGGDKIGRRRVDTHISGLMGLGAELSYDSNKHAYQLSLPDGKHLTGKYMLLDEASVTGTANILMAASLAEGKTVIYNAACEPYIQQLSRMLTAMGARIEGIGSNLLTVTGVSSLHGATHRILPDILEHQKYLDEIGAKRKTMVSTGDRSAKIRTYNYPQGRVTDHRINWSMYNLPVFMDGDIQECINQLQIAENAERLKEAGD